MRSWAIFSWASSRRRRSELSLDDRDGRRGVLHFVPLHFTSFRVRAGTPSSGRAEVLNAQLNGLMTRARVP